MVDRNALPAPLAAHYTAHEILDSLLDSPNWVCRTQREGLSLPPGEYHVCAVTGEHHTHRCESFHGDVLPCLHEWPAL